MQFGLGRLAGTDCPTKHNFGLADLLHFANRCIISVIMLHREKLWCKFSMHFSPCQLTKINLSWRNEVVQNSQAKARIQLTKSRTNLSHIQRKTTTTTKCNAMSDFCFKRTRSQDTLAVVVLEVTIVASSLSHLKPRKLCGHWLRSA